MKLEPEFPQGLKPTIHFAAFAARLKSCPVTKPCCFRVFPQPARATPRTAALKEAIVASFASDADSAPMLLTGFDESDWLSVLWWLDISGMAIYFYHRACQIGADALLPQGVKAGLAQRLSHNRVRTQSLFDEARALATWLERGNVSYALLKGVTLTAHSVQERALRSQADLDFLIADRSRDLAIHYVHRLGYRLRAQCGSTLEFRAGAPTVPDLANIYSVKTQRALELHLATEGSSESQLLSRRVTREFDGARIYTLSPADILIEQARHLVKHLCGEHTRISWVLEFRRHVSSRRGDSDFWRVAELWASERTQGDVAMGLAVWLAEAFFGELQEEMPPQWRTEALPIRVRLWLERYARALLLSDTIGNKLYALLRKELPGGEHEGRTTCQILLPRVFPATILEAQPNESCAQRWARYSVETGFILRRMWFHFREGVRFAVEASRWNRAVARIGR